MLAQLIERRINYAPVSKALQIQTGLSTFIPAYIAGKFAR